MEKVVAGVDIGGTKIAIAIASPDGEIAAKRFLSTQPELGAYAIFENIARTLDEMVLETEAALVSIGIGSPAPIDVEKGLIISPSNLRDWDNFPVTKLFADRFMVPVMLDNDANAAALGEFMFGAGRGHSNLFYVTVSTGIGGGMIINGEVYHGVATGAGEIGHTIVRPDGVRCNCGSIGCLETISSGVHIARRAKERLKGVTDSTMIGLAGNVENITAKTVVDAVRQGDPLAVERWEETCVFLAVAVANAITLLSPEIVVIGGGIASAGELLLGPLRQLVPRYVSMIPHDMIQIVQAELGTDSGLHGTIAIAQKAYSKAQLTYAV
jgi:glucokinase